MKYFAPQLVEFGNTKDLIKGDCSWGSENLSMDKTGYYEYETWKCDSALRDCKSVTVCRNYNPGDGCDGDDSNC